MSSRLDGIKASRPGVTIRFWIDSKPVPVEERDCEYVGKDDLDWLLAEVERLTAERDAAIQRAEVAEGELAEMRDYLAQERKREILASLRGEEDANYE